MASRHTIGLLRSIAKGPAAGASRGYAVAAASPSSSTARAPLRTYRKATVPAAAAKPKVAEPVAPASFIEEPLDEFPMPAAEAVPDYNKIAPPISAVQRSIPAATSQGIEGEALVGSENDWSSSFKGLSEKPFSKETAEILLAPLNAEDIEIKPGQSA